MISSFTRRSVVVLCAFSCCASNLCVTQVSRPSNVAQAFRNATNYPGASIVERIQAAILDCHDNPCEVFVPGGTFEASPISSWQQRDSTGSRAGVKLPSNVDLRGAGVGHTIIKVRRANGDPPATLFAAVAINVRLHDMSIVWDDSAASYDWISIFICHACRDLELDHLSLEGNPNKLVNLLDSSASSVHDNTFLLRSTSYGHGDNALSFSRFDPSIEVNQDAGVARDNRFAQIGEARTFSMLIVAQSGLYVHDNVFEAHLPHGNATGIESGQDNLGRLPTKVKISSNIFHDASIAYGGLATTEISGNFLDHGDIYIALQDGSTDSATLLTIADNELHFGTINVGGLAHTFTGRSIITHNRVFDGGISAGNSLVMRDMEVSFNSVRDTRGRAGIECDACSVIRGNLVREVGQDGPGDRNAGYVISGAPVDVSDNIYVDEQHEYDAGTVCSVEKPSSTACMSSGKSRWVMLRRGEWGFGWTNRVLFTGRGNRVIRAFVNNALLELDDDDEVLPAGTQYHLYRTTYDAFQLNSVAIERFSNNVAIATTGTFRNAAIAETGKVTIRSMSGNVFRPYKCVGSCTIDYRGNVNPPD